MDSIMGIEVGIALRQVQLGITDAASRLGTQALPLKLDSVDLALSVVWTAEAGGKFKFKVPVIGWEIGPALSTSSDWTQTLEVSLKPADRLDVAPPHPDVRTALANALVEAAEIISVASDQGMTADKAVVTLELAFSAEGTVEVLVLTAGAKHAITSTLTVNLVPA